MGCFFYLIEKVKKTLLVDNRHLFHGDFMYPQDYRQIYVDIILSTNKMSIKKDVDIDKKDVDKKRYGRKLTKWYGLGNFKLTR